MMTIEQLYKEIGAQSDVEWLASHREPWMSDDQWLIALFFNRLLGGFHHCPKFHRFGRGVKVNLGGGMATFDFDRLTKAVIMSHNWGVRLELCGSGPGMFGMIAHKRHKRTGSISERAPTISEAVEMYKDY